MNYSPDFSSFQPKHLKLLSYAEHPLVSNIMAAGGIRSGKSVAIMAAIIYRALMAPKSTHGVFHAYANVCDRNLLNYTLEVTFNIIMPGYWDDVIVKNKCINQTDRILTLPNGSRIYFIGLDDSNKVRGLEFATVWINEANIDIDYDAVMDVQGRLTQPAKKLDGTPLDYKLFIDLNPTVKSSWEYQSFVLGRIPGETTKLPNRTAWKWMTINAIDNVANLPPGTAVRLFAGMSEAKRAREERGEWSDDNPNALFDLEKIQRGPVKITDLKYIAIAIDPAGSSHKKSDMTGIIVAGKGYDGRYYVLEDATLKGKPDEWAQKAVDLYGDFNADFIVAERNNGGDMVEAILKHQQGAQNIPIKTVWASRGKRVRAEPIQLLYNDRMVTHTTPFRELEQQMIEFDAPGFKGSPDRVDALVWALTFLSEKQAEPATVHVSTASGFWRR